MNANIKKALLCAGALALFAALLVVMYALSSKRQENSEWDTGSASSYADRLYSLKKEQLQMQKHLTELKNEYSVCSKGEASIVLCFSKANPQLISGALPLLNGAPAVFVLNDKKIPGDEGMLSDGDYRLLNESGWQPALGGVFPVNAEELSEWEQTLDEQIIRLNAAGYETPTAYCFSDKRHETVRAAVSEALRERGFLSVSWYGGEAITDGILCYNTVSIKQDESSNATASLEKLSFGKSIVVSTGTVSDSVADKSEDTGVEKYQLMLDYIKNNFSETAVKTFEGIAEYKQSVRDDSRTGELAVEIEKLNREIETKKKEILRFNTR